MTRRNKFRLPIYLIPIMFGLCGILIASQIVDNPLLQNLVLLFSICVPLFAVGTLVTKLNVSGLQKAALIIGVILLAIGALVTISQFGHVAEIATKDSMLPRSAELLGRWLGISSLIVGLFGIVYILTRREEEFEVVADRFRYLADHMSEGFILTNAEGTITLVNEALLALTGLKREDLIGKGGRELAERYRLTPMLSHMTKRSQGIATEYNLPWTRNGKELQLWVNGTPLFDASGRFSGSLATVRDVTEQHQMSKRLERYAQGLQELVEDRTEKLYQSRQRLRDLLLHMNEAFVTLDREYRITFANERFCELLSVTADSVLQKDVFEFVESAERGRLLELLSMPKPAEGPRLPQELSLRTPEGATLHVVASAAAVEPAPGIEDRHSLVMTDIRELKRMQIQLEVRAAELEEANAELRMLDRAKDNFLSTVSHELRTPLSTVRGYTEMLDAGTLGELQVQQSNALKVMSRNLERLQSLIDEIIEFSRIEVRGLQLHQTLFSGEKLFAECAASIAPQTQLRDLHVRVQASPDAAVLWGDRRRLIQAIAILLSNSVKFCNPGDIITLTSERRAGGIIALGVCDTGIGIDPSVQRRVFDKFYQADNSLARRYEGAGIGLAIAKAIAEAHGGHIDLQSAPGKGSTFTLILAQARFLPTDHADLPKVDSSKEVLLAVSEPEFAQALREVLEPGGLQVSVVQSGMACLRAVKQSKPDMLIVDDVLPDLGGAATIARLREDPDTLELPILLMAGDNRLPDGDALGIQEGASCLLKPFSAEELLASIAAALEIPGRPNSAGNQRRLRKASAPTVLAISQDRDLLEWTGSALRARQVRCVCAASIDEARSASSKYNVQVVAVETDTAESDAPAVLKAAQEIASEHGAQLALLTTDARSPKANGGNGYRLVQVPCSARELAEALSQSASLVS